MVKKIFFLLFVLMGGARGLTLFEFLGGQKVGTTTMAFLKIPVGAKQGGLGETGVAIANDATCIYWNPSSISFIPSKISSSFFTQKWIGDTYYSYAGFAYQIEKYTTVGVMAGNLHSGYIQRTDEYHPFGLGTYFRTSSTYAGITVARKLIDRFAFGLNLKYMTEALDDYSQYTAAIDLGTYYLVGYRDIALGISIANIGPDPKVIGPDPLASPASFSLPVIYRLGVYGSPLNNFYLSLQLDKSTDNVEIFRVGAEYLLREVLALRVGYKLNSNIPGEYSGITGGIGISRSLGFRKDIHVDYSVSFLGYAGIVHKGQVGVNF